MTSGPLFAMSLVDQLHDLLVLLTTVIIATVTWAARRWLQVVTRGQEDIKATQREALATQEHIHVLVNSRLEQALDELDQALKEIQVLKTQLAEHSDEEDTQG